MTNRQKLKGNLILMLTAFVWGTGFIAQSEGMKIIGANTFNGLRMLLGSAVLLPFIIVSLYRQNHSGKSTGESPNSESKELIIGSLICGAILCFSSTIQTWGLAYTTAGKSGFITAMYMIFVPIIGIFTNKKITVRTMLCAFTAICGMYLLCIAGNDTDMNFGDLLTLLCAFGFSAHIMCVDYFSSRTDAVRLSCLQFFVCGILNVIFMFILEDVSFEIISSCAFPILYSGIFSCGIGYTLQIVGQRYADPTPASIIMSLESVFALILGMIILHEPLSVFEFTGCILMFAAIILIQLPAGMFKRKV